MSAKSILIILLLSSLTLVSVSTLQAAEPLGSSEQFKVDQVHRSLDNVDKDLERIATADRDAAAAMALKGAQRNLDQARDRFEQFASRHQDLLSHPDVEAASSRLDRLAEAVGQSSAAPSTPAASTASPSSAEVQASTPAPARQSAESSMPAASHNEPSLSRKQQFELQQVGMSIDDAEERLDAFRDADREDAAALALKAAKRSHAKSVDRLAAFVEANPGAAESDQVASLHTRIATLGSAIESTEAGAEAAEAEAAVAGASASEDAERILALRSEHDEAIRTIHGRSLVYYGTADELRDVLDKIESAEASAQEIRPFLMEFRERYGGEREAVRNALDAAGAQAESDNTRVAYNAATLYEFLEKLDGTREVSAETVAEEVAGRLADIDDFSAKMQQQRMSEAAEMVRLGQAIDPNNARLNRLRGEVAHLSEAKQAEQMARIDAATWPGHVADFEGPGNVGELSESVRSYLAADRDWGQSEKRPQDVLAVSVTGPWQVAAKDVFGRPIQWRLPVTVAITDDELRPDGIAQAFEVSMVAKEGAPDQAPKSPPWDGFWVGDNYYLKVGELP